MLLPVRCPSPSMRADPDGPRLGLDQRRTALPWRQQGVQTAFSLAVFAALLTHGPGLAKTGRPPGEGITPKVLPCPSRRRAGVPRSSRKVRRSRTRRWQVDVDHERNRCPSYMIMADISGDIGIEDDGHRTRDPHASPAIANDEGWLCLATVIDISRRRCPGRRSSTRDTAAYTSR